MTPQDLKNSILERAIQGALVNSIPNDDFLVDMFLQEMAREKEKLITDRIIRKEKNVCIDDDYPYETPNNWRLVRLGDLVYNISGLSYKKDVLDIKETTMITVLRGGNIGDLSYSFRGDDIFIGKSYVKDELLLKRNTLITPAVTSIEHIGKLARIEKDYNNVVVGGFVLMLIPYISNDIFSKYLLYALSSLYHRNKFRSITNKSGQAFYNLSREKMMNVVIPVPPLEEQRCIVAKIEELLPLVEQYGKAYENLETFNARFPEDMKKSILQYAMQGKLVEQRAEEGTAEELYRQIQQEKAELIKLGKIKKEKPLADIAEDEIPFDIPDSWKWVRLADIVDVRDGTHDSPKYYDTGIPLITSKNISGGSLSFDDVKYISLEDAEKINERSKVDVRDILFAMIGSIGNPVIVDVERNFCIKNVALFKNYAKTQISTEYLYWYLFMEQFIMKKIASGGVQSFISLKVFRNYLFPLPPYGEQKRIVAKIEELLPYCDRLLK